MFFEPAQALAQNPPKNYSSLVDFVLNIINSLIPVLIGLGLLVFLWGGVSFLTARGSEESLAVAKQRMFWGIIILFVMVSFWGILSFFVTDVFGLGRFVIPLLPEN